MMKSITAKDPKQKLTVEHVYTVFQNPENRWAKIKAVVVTAEKPPPPARTGYSRSEPPVKRGQNICIVGIFPFSLSRRIRFEVAGHWEKHPKYGMQFTSTWAGIPDPLDEKGIAVYLGSGVIPGIGTRLAIRIAKKFGDETLKILDQNPARIAQVPGIGKSKLEAIKEAWPRERAMAETIGSLSSLGIPLWLGKQVVRKYGGKAADIVKTNPYRLIEFDGVGFLKADEIAGKMGVLPESPERAVACILHVLNEESAKGHCYATTPDIIRRAAELLAANMKPGRAEIRTLVETLIETERTRDGARTTLMPREYYPVFDGFAVFAGNPASAGRGSWAEDECGPARLYPIKLHEAENTAARILAEMLQKAGLKHSERNGVGERLCSPMTSGAVLNRRQQEAITMMLDNNISILAGLPGTGKTTSLLKLLDILDHLKLTYTLCAPTGKAADRMKKTTGRNASTVHRLLFQSKAHELGTRAEKPFATDYVIMDESSMVDISLLAWMLPHVKDRLVLVGDPHQIPSVSPGNCMGDLIRQGDIPFIELKEIQRQAADSPIIMAAHRVHAGSMIEDLADGKNLVFIPVDDSAEIRRRCVQFAADRSKQPSADPNNIQILAPMKKGQTGTDEMNAILQRQMTGLHDATSAFKFNVGDKIIHTKNRYRLNVMNGEMGTVRSVDDKDKTMEVVFQDGRTVRYDREAAWDLSLAYAITIHKSQGSEFDTVIIPVSAEHSYMFRNVGRNLLYTAVTRAKKELILIGSPKTLRLAIENNNTIRRNTTLKEKLRSLLQAKP